MCQCYSTHKHIYSSATDMILCQKHSLTFSESLLITKVYETGATKTHTYTKYTYACAFQGSKNILDGSVLFQICPRTHYFWKMKSSMGRHPSDLSGTYSNTILTLVLDESECVVTIVFAPLKVLMFYCFIPLNHREFHLTFLTLKMIFFLSFFFMWKLQYGLDETFFGYLIQTSLVCSLNRKNFLLSYLVWNETKSYFLLSV